MANILRIMLFRSGYLRHSAGFLQSPFQSSVTPNFSFHSLLLINKLMKSSTVVAFRKYSDFSDFKSFRTPHLRTKFDTVFHEISFFKETNENVLVHEFNKLLKVYNQSMRTKKFILSLSRFLESERFRAFCSHVRKKLHNLSPTALILFTDLHLFETPTAKAVTKEVFNLIFKHTITGNKECQNIMKALEVYFEQNFLIEIHSLNFSEDLMNLIRVKTLPLRIKRVIADKLVEEAFLGRESKKDIVRLITILGEAGPEVVKKDSYLLLIKKVLFKVRSSHLIEKMCRDYMIMVQKDESFYDKELLDILTSSPLEAIHSPEIYIAVIQDGCLMGHIYDHFPRAIERITLREHMPTVRKKTLLTILNILVRYSAHETIPKDVFESFIERLHESEFVERHSSVGDICTWCENMTYLGCDMKDLCSQTFRDVRKNFSEIEGRKLFSLHHTAKVYFSNGYKVLPEKTLNDLLRQELKDVGLYPSDVLNDYFCSEDYVLKGCTTSEKHCLHYVSLFGLDNRPIDLSKYKDLLNSEEIFDVEKIERPPGSKMIVFQIFPDSQPIKFLNSPQMSGKARLYLKKFENLDCSVVLLPPKFFNMKPEGRGIYLKSQIDEVLKKENLACASVKG